MDDTARTGWYGKLPSLGDFASRRLAPGLVEAWDRWLAEGLAHWREADPEGWLDGYLAGPSWRFVLMPGALPGLAAPLAGVLMPSVDRVGRYFPLTLMRGCGEAQLVGSALPSWLHRLDDLALDAMHEDWPVEQFEDELARLDNDAEITEQVDGIDALPALRKGQACWWRIANEDGRRRTQITDALPRGAAFVALLSGHTEHDDND